LGAIRTLYICLIAAGVAAAQDAGQNASQSAVAPSPLAALEQAVKQKTTEWDGLQRSVNASLLPCDPKVAAAIAAVSQASDARIAAGSAYVQAAVKETMLQITAARRVLASVQPLGADLATEKADLAQEQSGAGGQIAILNDSGQHRPAFNGAQDGLRQIVALEQQRAEATDSGISHGDATREGIRGLLAQLEARATALEAVQTAFEAESSAWKAYYAARSARAQTECNATKGLVSPPRPQPAPQGKQK
jgi:hypothetical protein